MDLFSVVRLAKPAQVTEFTEVARVEQERIPSAVTELQPNEVFPELVTDVSQAASLGFIGVPEPERRDPSQSLKRKAFDEHESTSTSKRGRDVELFIEQVASPTESAYAQ